MFFMGTHQSTLDGLKQQLSQLNPAVGQMSFYELPFLKVEQFDYPAIARMIETDAQGPSGIHLPHPARPQEATQALLGHHQHPPTHDTRREKEKPPGVSAVEKNV